METAASLVLCSDAEDLQALAAAHRCFEEVVRDGCRLPDPLAGGRLVTTSADAARLVEKLILREIADTESAMKTVILAVREMQALLSGNAGSGIIDARPAAEPKRDASTPAEHAHVAIDAETALNPEDAPLAAEFIAEATTHVETAEANLLKLEETPDDPEAVNAIFRSFHTVKGVAGFLNLKQIGALAHSAENLLDLARKEKLKLAGEAVDVVLESIDLLKALLAATGFRYDGIDGHLRFANAGRPARWFWSSGDAWGTVEQSPAAGKGVAVKLAVKGGTLRLNRLEIVGVGSHQLPEARTLAGVPVRSVVEKTFVESCHVPPANVTVGATPEPLSTGFAPE